MSPRALVTGGQQGIGLGIARALAGAGWEVVIAAERPEGDGAVTDALAELGAGARYLRHDLADLAAVPALVEAAGRIDAYVSNAGVPARVRGDMLALEPQNFDWTMDINLRGAFFLAQAMARRMIGRPPEARAGTMIFVTSVSAEMASPERAEYCISKAAASMMARLFAARLAPEGIGVFELRPGIIDTAMTAGVRDRYQPMIEGGLVPARRWGTPGDIGQIALALAEGRMGFATGAVIPVDGGLSIPRL